MAATANPKNKPWEVNWGAWGRLHYLKHGPYTACIQSWLGRKEVSWHIFKDMKAYSYHDGYMHPHRALMGQGKQTTTSIAMDKCLEVLEILIKE